MRREPTPAGNSGNTTAWEKYIDLAFLVANSLILLITSFVGTAANIFVAFAVYHQKSLQTCNNALLVNLAVIDVLRCAVDCPILLTIIISLYQRGHVDELICSTQVVSFSFSCCIQLLTLACISAERYQAIAQPFKNNQRKRRLIALIPLTWTLAIIVAVFCLTYFKNSPVYVRCKGAQWEKISSYDTFGLYILIPLWAACFGVITGFYARIFTLVRAHNRKIFDKGIFAHSKEGKLKGGDETKEDDITVVKTRHRKPEETGAHNDLNQVKNNSGGETLAVATEDQVSLPHQVSSNTTKTEPEKANLELAGAVCMMPSLANKERVTKKKESKMAKRSGYIILTFLLFWLPLITTILVNFLVYQNRISEDLVIVDVEILSVCIACMTSLSDPIIYAAVNPQFRTEFYRLRNRLKSTFNR
ncbi:hypothetical protein LDENG_00278610 [Lucifuga dentata]|nr:hypothetical protein LDENG_00278610 [Lucifuga dentata]